MTPEQIKAKELVEKFGIIQFNKGDIVFDKNLAKSCALIAVEEIISQLAEINNVESFNISQYAVFWQSVKKEIEKL